MKKPDNKEYTPERLVLKINEIDHFACDGSVYLAVERKLPNAYRAMGHLNYLYALIDAGDVPVRVETIPGSTDGVILPDSTQYFISGDEAKNFFKKVSGHTLSGKSEKNYLKAVRALLKYVEMAESGMHKPPFFENRAILHSNGEVIKEALKELLMELYPSTPSRIDDVFTKAYALDDDNDDIDID